MGTPLELIALLGGSRSALCRLKKTFKKEVENLRKKGVILSDWKKKMLEVEYQLGILDKEQLLLSVGINDESKLQRIHRDLIMKLL